MREVVAAGVGSEENWVVGVRLCGCGVSRS